MNNLIKAITLCATLLCATISAGCSEPKQELTLEQKAAKMLIVGLDEKLLTEHSAIKHDIVDLGISGVILFEKNVESKEQLRKFISDLKSLRTEPLFVSIDQEGGFVNRLKTKYGFRQMPSQRSVAQRGNKEHLDKVATTLAEEVASVGINLNFSPCVDLDINPTCPVIGAFQRSFSADEDIVIDHARAYIEAQRSEGIITCLKHFPGHGNSLKDSHNGFTDITNTWQECELEPYRTLIQSKECDMVMVSHLYNSCFDAKYPATLSRPTIDSLLRGVLKWDGVVITDDMQMKAITKHYGFEQSIQLAIAAGVDLFIVGNNINKEKDSAETFIQAVVDGVESGVITTEQVDQAVARIEKLRDKIRE